MKSALVSQSFDPKATQLEQFLIVWHDPVLYILLKKIQVLLGKYVCTYLLPKVGSTPRPDLNYFYTESLEDSEETDDQDCGHWKNTMYQSKETMNSYTSGKTSSMIRDDWANSI